MALVVHAGLLISYSSNDIALRLKETETKLLQMEEILHDHEMVNNLATMLSKNPGNIEKMSYNKAKCPDGTENSELTVTMKDAEVDQPPADNNNQVDEIIMEAPKPNDEAPPADTPPDPLGEQKHKPWRFYWIRKDLALVLDCADDKLTLHIRPASAGLNNEEPTRAGHACTLQEQAFLYDLGEHRTLFLSPPGKERVVPVPWPRAEMFQKMTAAVLRGQETPASKHRTVPESLSLSPDVAMFYRPGADGMTTELLVSMTETLEYVELGEEDAVRTGTALTPPSILPSPFPDFSK